MRILKLYLIIFLSFEVILAAACHGESLMTKDIQGIWTREKYVVAVRLTRSPFSVRPETVTIKNDKFYWTSYHEGSWRKIICIEKGTSKGVYRMVLGGWEIESPSSEITEVPFKLVKNQNGKVQAIAFLDASVVTNKQEPFVNISLPLEQVVAELVLVGTYKDEKGQTYSFNKSGTAQWPSQSFSYEVALDSMEASCDFFQANDVKNPSNTKSYGFKWVAGKLELLKIKRGNEGIRCEDRPFVILLPLTK